MHATKMHAAPSAAGQAGVRGAPRLGADRSWTRVAAARPLKPARVVRVGSFSDSRKPAGQAGSRKFFNSAANEVRRKTPSRDARDAFFAHRNRWTFDTTSKDADAGTALDGFAGIHSREFNSKEEGKRKYCENIIRRDPGRIKFWIDPVSYTHLKLPTIYSV